MLHFAPLPGNLLRIFFTQFDLKAYLPDGIVFLQFHINQSSCFDCVRSRISPFPIRKRVRHEHNVAPPWHAVLTFQVTMSCLICASFESTGINDST